jgi:hypothetical protein
VYVKNVAAKAFPLVEALASLCAPEPDENLLVNAVRAVDATPHQASTAPPQPDGRHLTGYPAKLPASHL